MAFSFQDALNQTVDTIERPPLAPMGHYEFVVQKVPTITERGTFDIIEFNLQAVAPVDVDDTEGLQAYGPLKKLNVRKSFLFDKEDEVAAAQTLANLRSFLEKTMQVEFEGVPLKQALNSTVNKKLIGQLKYRADKNDPSIQYHDLGTTAPVEA